MMVSDSDNPTSSTAPADKPEKPGRPARPKKEAGAPAAEKVANRASVGPGNKGSDTGVEEPIDRRGFLNWLLIGWLGFGALVLAAVTGFVRFLFPNVLFEPPQTFSTAPVDALTDGQVSIQWKNEFGVWMVRDDNQIYALSTVCTHLGCTPNWLEGDQKFKCPCHGSGFRKSGINFEGPAPRPLERFRVTLGDDGSIVVDKTRKFQQEKGEWSDPESFIAV